MRLADSSSGKELSKSTAKKRESTRTVIASFKVHYDDWGDDSALIESGSQYTELVSALFFGRHIRQNFDSWSFAFEGGFAQADVSRLEQRSQFSSPLDTFLFASYSTFDNKTSGWEGSIALNLPTGNATLNESELAAVPNSSVVSRFIQGKGLNVGMAGKYIKQLGSLRLYFGGGATRKGEYDPTKDRANDDVDGGFEYEGKFGGNFKFDGSKLFKSVKFQSVLTRVEGVANEQANVASFLVSPELKLGEVSVTGQYELSYSDGFPEEATEIEREEKYREGFKNKLKVDGKYPMTKFLALQGSVRGSVSDSSRPADPSYFATNESYSFGIGNEWKISGLPLTQTSEVKYFEVSTTGRDDPSVTFSGLSVFVKVSARF